ncbi:hypothetical protein [Alkalihalobacterium elongatum]|uniref:hypothetical protein n=1 Tax=Alkalihalobacterium elongatum TaxID=2675466 RepID=UPI001C1FC3A9|nr:hypothetical protein [Alkalihalobacterium elongatum]
MDKSAFLDELRLEVGLVSDHANSQHEFFNGIIQVFGKYIKHGFSAGLYKSQVDFFKLIACAGDGAYDAMELFGEGHLSLCAIRGRISILDLEYSSRILAPFYEGHHLIGIIVFDLPKVEYEVTEEDLIFVREICRHIELNQNQYSN